MTALTPDRVGCPEHPGHVCGCIVCVFCGEQTGNADQGHFWSYCSMVGVTRMPHFCCPAGCELETPSAWF